MGELAVEDVEVINRHVSCGLVDCKTCRSLDVFRGVNGTSECMFTLLKISPKTHGCALIQRDTCNCMFAVTKIQE